MTWATCSCPRCPRTPCVARVRHVTPRACPRRPCTPRPGQARPRAQSGAVGAAIAVRESRSCLLENASSKRRKKSAPAMEVSRWNQGKPVEASTSSSIHENKLAKQEAPALQGSPHLRDVSAPAAKVCVSMSRLKSVGLGLEGSIGGQ
jgi:hypothetical protein